MLNSQTRRSSSGTARESYRVLSILALFAFGVAALFVVSVSSRSSKANRAGDSALRTNHRMSMRPSSDSLRSTPLGAPALAVPLLATITVDRTDDNPAASACTAAASDCSLRGAVAFANLNPATTISVPAGTYLLTINGGFGEGFNGDNSIGDLDITATNTSIVGAGAATTIIQQTQPNDRVIEVNPFLDAAFVTSISDVTITGGKETTAVGGGGIIAGSIDNALTVTNCVLSGNSATGAGTFGGGGISFAGGNLTVSGTTFSGNSTSGSGGAVGYTAGDPLARTPSVGLLTVTSSTFSNNSAASVASGGGALDLFGFNLGTGSYSITSSSFQGNTATSANGGAILVESGGPLTVTTSAFTSNTAGNSGGAVFSNASVATIRYSRFVGNSVPTPTNGLTLFEGSGLFTADDNWWGVNTGPGPNDFRNSSGTVIPITYLQLRATANPNAICVGDSSSIVADIKQRNAGPALTVELNGLPPFPASFTNTMPAVGNLTGASANFVDGQATATFTGTAVGTGLIDVIADNQAVTASVLVQNDATTALANQMVCEGGTASFTTNSSGPGSFTYVWKKGATVLNTGDLGGRVTIVSGANSSTLSIINAQPSDADTYTVEATGSCSTVTRTATLTINAATSTTDPVDTTVCQGATANFSTTASGTGPFSYAWTVDGSPAGTNSPNLAVDTTSLSVGNHTVVVTTSGTCGSASQTATLTVQPPTATTDPVDTTVCQGATANFSTTASGTGPFHYAWTVGGTAFGGDTASINVPTGSMTAGSHIVTVTTTGECGSATQSATLTVNTAPAVTQHPQSQTVTNGGNVTFTAAASGQPTPTVQWQVSTNGGASFSDIPGATNTSLTFATNSSQNGNQYRAVFTNECGTATTTAATLTTCTPAQVTSHPQSVADACVGSVVTFSASASGFPTPTVQWQVSTNGGGTWTNIGGATSPSLNVTASVAVRNNQYRAVFTNDCGTATTNPATLGVDTIAPVITLNNNTITLWPPNHSYHTINVADLVASASDNCSSDLLSSVVISSVSSDESENGNGDGNTSNDIVIAANCKSVQLRAERQGGGNGRVYRINFVVTDSAGNISTVTGKVYVPKNANSTAVDDGPAAGYTVTSACP